MSWRFGTSITLWMLLLISSKVHGGKVDAECPKSAPEGIEPKVLAKEWFDRAEAAVKEGEYDRAVGAYGCSYRFYEHPNTLFNMGQAALMSGDDVQARPLFSEMLEKYPDDPLTVKAKSRIIAIENRKKRVSKETDPLPGTGGSSPKDEPLVASLNELQNLNLTMKRLGLGLTIGGGVLMLFGIPFQVASSYIEDEAAAPNLTAKESDHLTLNSYRYQIFATTFFVTGVFSAAVGITISVLHRSTNKSKLSWTMSPTSIGMTRRF
jgi:tetratricopeptide (TPR) repeat protein